MVKLLLMKSTLPGKKLPQQNFEFPSGVFPSLFNAVWKTLPLLNKFLETLPRHPPSPQIVEGGGGGATK